jgi:hypothetical protein
LYALLQNAHNGSEINFRLSKGNCTKVLVSVNMLDCTAMIYNIVCEKTRHLSSIVGRSFFFLFSYSGKHPGRQMQHEENIPRVRGINSVEDDTCKGTFHTQSWSSMLGKMPVGFWNLLPLTTLPSNLSLGRLSMKLGNSTLVFNVLN